MLALSFLFHDEETNMTKFATFDFDVGLGLVYQINKLYHIFMKQLTSVKIQQLLLLMYNLCFSQIHSMF